MGDHHQYGLADLRQMIAGRTRFPVDVPQPAEVVEQFLNGHPNLTIGHHYEMLMLGPRQLGSSGGGGGGVGSDHQHYHPHHHHHQVVLPRGVMEFCSADSTTTNSTTNITTNATATTNPTTTGGGGGGDGDGGGVCGSLEMMEAGCCNMNNVVNGGGITDGGNSRWPRQETLTLLEIRSRLDHRFKEANQKGPLWDEVSRIMAEEHGYQRSGKKCREKFENLYKYYKKTKEGKAGRQDGKNYRFFRQLEALYGETAINNPVSVSETHFDNSNILRFQTTNNTTSTQSNIQTEGLLQAHHQKHSESLSLSNSSEFDTTSSSEEEDANDNAIAFMENDDSKNKKLKDNQRHKRGSRKNWKAKIKDFVDSRMKKLMETQEAWLEKMLKTLENKEQERIHREEEWKKQETARLDREHKFWAKERAWFEARDAALMEALQRFIGTELKVASPEEVMARDIHENSENQNENGTGTLEKTNVNSHTWPEAEISSLIHLRTGMESRFQQCGCSEGALWEEISAKMTCLGYDRSAQNCEEKWMNINKYIRKTNECNKKRKENSRSACPYFQHVDSLYSHEGAFAGHGMDEEGPETMGIQLNDGPSPSNSNAGTTVQDNCFRFMMTTDQRENLWENYGVKLNKGGN
ncbi:SANT/Myb domain [Macleaya cordata]|uniref:SANT/Myb domain n=1 Tax=Macleaya cordata TaxID=56857 RepID=A0A200Q641_MACCD|nr:SANT/Myb domain [Macleaya cordata]